MKKISKALSVLCSMTTFACMLGTNPAIAMVRDDGAAAAEQRKDEENRQRAEEAERRRVILEKLEKDRQRAEEAGRRREESSKELGKLEMELAEVRQRLGKVKQALMTLKLSETPDASKVREAIEEEKNQKKEVEEAELRVREATKKFEALKMEERRAVERNIITEIEAFDLGIISCPPVDDYRLWRVRELIGWNMKKFDENLKTAGQISRLDHDFGLGAIFGAIIPDLDENLSNLKKLEEEIRELLSKESNVHNMEWLRSISYKVRSLIEYYDYRGRNVGEKAIELIYGKDENLQYMVGVKHRNELSHPEVWTAGFLSFLKSHGVEKLNLDIDYGKRYGEAMFNELMNNSLDIHNPVFCALVAFAKCIKQNNESLSGVIDVYIKLAEVASAVSSIYGRSPYKEVVNRFYRTMNPDGTPNEDSVKEIEELEKRIRCGTIWR